ncbi:NADH-dependent butanol dehydrogenase BdhB [Clostridium felsineum]|uniref:NADH-dependent butanol dehydrogenase B n=1 Tax=Clostridium felsineum TaxID=36839 RepID=A0A1S8LU11_9CLOT|nr:NADH-dependent butanol dehydrogenase BdhB [Clostridium felsineum]URZ08410.1 NADH-dependent butanol dehydrogenase B [Clostridium felsineum]URZ13441.1 NADH-dependent butanol dehydrogenase B [Clostridium felsineum]URZ14588.1 NADH-dependent butanol dehydrogenase B [Clostridium felsineum DSM 794]
MVDFEYSIPTKIFFGKDKINVLGREVKKYGSKVLIVYGGGSIKRNGIYDKAISILKENGISYYELPGVEPNPRITTVKKGIDICKENGVELVLAIGGGSAIDCAKVVAAGCDYEGDPWDIVLDGSKIKKVLPIASILTLAATGSEMDSWAVINNMETNEKLIAAHPDMAPTFSILDPTYTFTVPKNQTAAGTADIMSHVFEVYFSNTKTAYLQDRMAEAVLRTCIKYGKIALEHPSDYEARANLMWASSLAINGLLTYGKDTNWSVHLMEHELSAFYDITHGVGLAILTPNWMEYILNNDTVYKFVEYGVNVWGIDKEKNHYDIAHEAIEKTRDYFVNALGIPARLKEVGIGEDKLDIMAKESVKLTGGTVGNLRPVNANEILEIFKKSL